MVEAIPEEAIVDILVEYRIAIRPRITRLRVHPRHILPRLSLLWDQRTGGTAEETLRRLSHRSKRGY